LMTLGAAAVNATTGTDRTTIYAFASRAGLDDLASTMATRMRDPLQGLDDAHLARERAVVGEEVSIRDEPSRLALRLTMSSMTDDQHPFDHPTEAMRGGLAAISSEDVRAFVARHYRPERTTLVLSGP